MKKKTLWKMATALLLCLVLCTACGRSDAAKDYSYYSRQYPNAVMLEAKCSNYGLESSEDNHWCSSHWSVTYSGQVVSYDTYNLAGDQARVEYSLSKEETEKVWKILDRKLKKYEDDMDTAEDGVGWTIRYYTDDDDEPETTYKGYIYGKEPLVELTELLRDSQEKAQNEQGIHYEEDSYFAQNPDVNFLGGEEENKEENKDENPNTGDVNFLGGETNGEENNNGENNNGENGNAENGNGGKMEREGYDEAKLREGYTDYSIELLKKTVTEKENSMISPLSVMMAMDMAAAGAQGDTQSQIAEMFCPGASQLQMESYCRDLMDKYNENKDVDFHIANSIWINDLIADRMNRDYMDKTKKVFDAEAEALPFDNAAAQKINKWVDKNTNGMIDHLLDEMPGDAVLYLINATAIEAPWDEPYEDRQVWEEDFTNAAGKKQKVEMMHSTEGQYFETKDAIGFMKYYKGYDYAFLTILPNEGTSVEEYLDSLTGEKYQEFFDSRSNAYDVYTKMPKFTYEYEVTMNDALKALGAKDAFHPGVADFSKIAEPQQGSLYIEKVLHKTFIEVGQYETRAAAVTSIERQCTSAFIETETREVYLDRPFIYAIVDTESGMPLFIGTLQEVK